MPSPMMRANTEDLNTAEKRMKRTVSIIGCGQTGIMQAILFAEAGFRVTCVDGDQTAINQIVKGKAPFLEPETAAKLKVYVKTGQLTATNDVGEAVSNSDVVAITTSVRINSKKKAEYSELEKTCKKLGSSLHGGSLVIVTSLTGIGITEGLVKETLENTSGLKAGIDFGLSYSPIQVVYTKTFRKAMNHQRIVAATDKESLDSASAILETINKAEIRRMANVKAAEIAALLEVLRRDVEVAFANETAILCEKAHVDSAEVQMLVEGDTGTIPAACRLADDSLSEEPYLLLEDAESLNVKPRLATAARDTNEETVKHVASMAKDALVSCGKTLKRARITLLGASQTPDSFSPIKRTARRIIENLEARGARISVYDPYLPENETVDAPHHFKRSLNEAIERADCVIILTAHDQFKHINFRKMKLTVKMPAAIIDLEGITEPSKIEKEGFIYRGIGRGVWKK